MFTFREEKRLSVPPICATSNLRHFHEIAFAALSGQSRSLLSQFSYDHPETVPRPPASARLAALC
jgi:hypothetical protein